MNRLYILLFSIGIAGILRVESRAQTVVAEDDCEAYTGNNYTDENKGSGFSSPFTFKAWGNDDQGGEFIETGSRKISGNQSFGLYANTSGTGKAVSRPFTTALSGLHRISFRVRFDLNTNNGNKSAGFAICNVPTSSQSNWNDGQRLYLGISGDGLWKYDDGTLKTVTSGGNNFSCIGGDIYLVELDITPSSNTYAFRITNESSSIQSDIISGTLAGSSGSSIASIGFGNGVIGNDQNLIFDDIVVTQNPSNPLPVELVDFQARFDRGSVWLSWRTASEQDNDRFEVEHSVDARHWATLGAVPGAGYSLQERTYGFRHDQPAAGINYYRLRQVDFDGSSAVLARGFSGSAPQGGWPGGLSQPFRRATLARYARRRR
ncbi:MAG: hypothetical protein KatS3mg029_0018 [Saprospiraceae bacterium]|nr:MAG: hypothetical protein KatS3mg029_0018 [Saprospiraceae bacterium]